MCKWVAAVVLIFIHKLRFRLVSSRVVSPRNSRGSVDCTIGWIPCKKFRRLKNYSLTHGWKQGFVAYLGLSDEKIDKRLGYRSDLYNRCKGCNIQGKCQPNCRPSGLNGSYNVAVSSGVAEFATEDGSLEHILQRNEETRAKIRQLAMELMDIADKTEFIAKMAEIGKKVYFQAPQLSLFRTSPDRLDGLKSFTSTDIHNLSGYNAGLGQDGSGSKGVGPEEWRRNYFIIESPSPVEYRLIEDCNSSVYLSFLTDDQDRLYIDGVSNSLILKSIISIIISRIPVNLRGVKGNGNVYGSVANLEEDGLIKRIREFNVVSGRAFNNILNHFKSRLTEYSTRLVQSRTSESQEQDLNYFVMNKPVKENKPRSNGSKRVALLLSGGVDSSLSLWMLKNRGFDVQAFYLRVNDPNDKTGVCRNDDIEWAKKACERVGVDLHVLPFSKPYYDRVLSEFIENYRIGEVPNPDIFCNSRIKFGFFLEQALKWGFDKVASGHYASLQEDFLLPEETGGDSDLRCGGPEEKGPDTRVVRLKLCTDLKKDQTYFLSRLDQYQLKKLIFPLSSFRKDEVREVARVAGLPNCVRKDSVGLCFLEDLKIREFLRERIGDKPGPIVDYGTRQIIGEHPGVFNYSIGQRRNVNNYVYGKCFPHLTRHVVKKDLKENVLYVSQDYDSEPFLTEGVRRSFKIVDIKFNTPDYHRLLSKCRVERGEGEAGHGGDEFKSEWFNLRVKVRHTPHLYDALVKFNVRNECKLGGDEDSIKLDKDYLDGMVFLKEVDSGISTGQFCVFYLDNLCLGSAKMITMH